MKQLDDWLLHYKTWNYYCFPYAYHSIFYDLAGYPPRFIGDISTLSFNEVSAIDKAELIFKNEFSSIKNRKIELCEQNYEWMVHKNKPSLTYVCEAMQLNRDLSVYETFSNLVTIHINTSSTTCRGKSSNEIEVYFDNKMYCIPEDYSSYNILCNENGGKTVCECAQGYLNIDNDFKNGCERHVANDLEFCGKGGLNINHTNCSDYLEENHAHLTDCNAGTCVYQSCMQGYGNCNGKLDDGCELALSSTKNCGECGKTCNLDCFTALQCKNKCSKSNESEQFTCCVEGDISKKHTFNQIKCCEGLKPYRFNQKWGSICTFSDHYGCFKSAPEGLYKNCWTEVTASK